MQIQFSGVKERIGSFLVGLEHGKYLIISVPATSAANMRGIFTRGKMLLVRYIHEGIVLGFESSVIDTILTPVQLIFLRYPVSVENLNLRKHVRRQCYLPASVIIDNKKTDGFMLDISEGGCKYSLKALLDVDSSALQIDRTITMEMSLPEVNGKLSVTGKLKNYKYDSDCLLMGILFTDVPAETRAGLQQYLTKMEEWESG
jgi:c-di-GMP-binding flagellar brake protein YcgR